MPRANRRHDDDLAVDELDTVARREDANLRHVVDSSAVKRFFVTMVAMPEPPF